MEVENACICAGWGSSMQLRAVTIWSPLCGAKGRRLRWLSTTPACVSPWTWSGGSDLGSIAEQSGAALPTQFCHVAGQTLESPIVNQTVLCNRDYAPALWPMLTCCRQRSPCSCKNLQCTLCCRMRVACHCSGFAEGSDSPYMEALLTSQREVEERTVHPVRQFYDLFTRVRSASLPPLPAHACAGRSQDAHVSSPGNQQSCAYLL